MCYAEINLEISDQVIRAAEDFDNLDLDSIFRHPSSTVLDVRADKKAAPPMTMREVRHFYLAGGSPPYRKI